LKSRGEGKAKREVMGNGMRRKRTRGRSWLERKDGTKHMKKSDLLGLGRPATIAGILPAQNGHHVSPKGRQMTFGT
jgi:hypothetical protein